MKVTATRLPGVLLIEPTVFSDARGCFHEAFRADRYEAAGIDGPFVQDNVSRSRRGVVRGLHFQQPHPQTKLVSVLAGDVFDVAVDVRARSPTFGQWTGHLLSAQNKLQLYIPSGFAHGFMTLSDEAMVAYKCSDYYFPDAECVLRWDDPDVAIDWPTRDVLLSAKDASAPLLRDYVGDLVPVGSGTAVAAAVSVA
jgi:dTDP-4-dehydrorhamnose 3,5-epimerase